VPESARPDATDTLTRALNERILVIVTPGELDQHMRLLATILLLAFVTLALKSAIEWQQHRAAADQAAFFFFSGLR